MSFYFAFSKEDFTDQDIFADVGDLNYRIRDDISYKYPLETWNKLYGSTQPHGYDDSYYYLSITVFNQIQLNELLENHTYLLEHLIMIICEEDDLSVEENEGNEDEIILDFNVLDNHELQNLKFVRLIHSDVGGLDGFRNCRNMLYFEAINIFTEPYDIQVIRNFNELIYCALCQMDITEIELFTNLIRLQHLYLWDNKITEIPDSIQELENIKILSLKNNPIGNYSHKTFRWLLRKNAILPEDLPTLYDDSQNVHNSSIQISLIESIETLFQDKLRITKEEMLDDISFYDIILSINVVEYILDQNNNTEKHSILDCTFIDVFLYVWNYIIQQDDNDELKKLLNDEIERSMNLCFTGRISNLVNVLTGYRDDIHIGITELEHKNNLMITARNNYKTVREQIQFIERSFEENGYDDVEEWTQYFENYEDNEESKEMNEQD